MGSNYFPDANSMQSLKTRYYVFRIRLYVDQTTWIPAYAGMTGFSWISAYAGMTGFSWIPACAGMTAIFDAISMRYL